MTYDCATNRLWKELTLKEKMRPPVLCCMGVTNPVYVYTSLGLGIRNIYAQTSRQSVEAFAKQTDAQPRSVIDVGIANQVSTS